MRTSLLICFLLLSHRKCNVQAFGLRASLKPHQPTACFGVSPNETYEDDGSLSPGTGSTTYRPGSLMAATVEQGRVPYGEDSRKFRRTIFEHQDWVDHRSAERLTSNLKGIFFSGIVRQLQSEVSLVVAVATSVLLWNDVLVPSEWCPPGFTLPLLSLPPLPFTLSSPALGLLLVFRTNASYSRWNEARNAWARVLSQSGNMIRMAATFTDLTSLEGRIALERLGLDTWILSRTLMNSLSGPQDEQAYQQELQSTIDDQSLSRRIAEAPDRCIASLSQVSISLDKLPIDEKRRVEIDKSIVIIGDCMGVCEKIYSSPVPLVYTRHTARFLSLWMLLLPTALYDTFADFQDAVNWQLRGLALIPAVAIVAVFLFGIDELAIQLEEPFSILPMQYFCDKLKQNTRIISDWSSQAAEGTPC